MSSRLQPLVALAVVLLLLASSLDAVPGPRHNNRHPTRLKPPCCVDISTQDISSQVIGTTYRMPSHRQPCVQAIILNTARGSVCVDPSRKWVRDIIANMQQV